jgi:DNA-binding transcriptional LysR family regulator
MHSMAGRDASLWVRSAARYRRSAERVASSERNEAQEFGPGNASRPRQEAVMDIQDIRIFARVAALRSLSAVGAELSLTPGTISKRLQALEDELSARLFDRSTRSIRITEEGTAFLAHAERILAEVDAACASVDDRVGRPKGKIRIAAPAGLGRRYVAPALCRFLRNYPQIEVQMDLQDRPVNLQEHGYDLAIHSGALPDSSVIAKRLAADRHVIAASPAYLAERGEPVRAEDLAAHSCLVVGDRSQWSLNKGEVEKTVRVSGPFRTNDGDLLRRAAIEGYGLIQASELEILRELRSGRLVQVLCDHEIGGNAAIWALYPSGRHMLPRMRVLLDFLTLWFRDARARGGDTHAMETATPPGLAGGTGAINTA